MYKKYIKLKFKNIEIQIWLFLIENNWNINNYSIYNLLIVDHHVNA